MVLFARIFGLGEKLTALLAIGSSICGVSAIIASKGAIDASDEDASFAIAAILALGAVGLFAYPAIGRALGMSDHAFGLWAGLAVDNTAEAAAAGSIFSDEAGRIAVLAKTTRNAMIGFVVLAAALFFAAREGRSYVGSRSALVWEKFPKFVLGFLGLLRARQPRGVPEERRHQHRESEPLVLPAHVRGGGAQEPTSPSCAVRDCGRSWLVPAPSSPWPPRPSAW